MDAKVCKRPAEQQTPERRQLFRDDDTNMSPSPAKVVSPPIKQPKKRTRAAAKPKPKAKAAASTAKVEDMKEAEEGKCTVEGETGEGGESNDKGEKETKSMRAPSEKLKKWAFDTLTAAKGDPASWFHAQKLFEGVKQTEKSCLAKWTYWQNSMYWTTRRVGVLQKQTLGGTKHVLSFGGGHCKHIGIPFVAAELFVRNLIALRSTCQNISRSSPVLACAWYAFMVCMYIKWHVHLGSGMVLSKNFVGDIQL